MSIIDYLKLSFELNPLSTVFAGIGLTTVVIILGEIIIGMI